MQNISINFQVPQGWLELGDKQLRYVYQLLAGDFSADEIKTLCLLQWSDTKVIGQGTTLRVATWVTLAHRQSRLALPRTPTAASASVGSRASISHR